MADPFLAEIRIFPFNYAPTGWAFCDGQLYPISQNTALYSLIGITYGGNGTTNFALPNIQGSCVIQPGQGQGLSLYDLGQTGGTETVPLQVPEMPAHLHLVQATTSPAETPDPTNTTLARSVNGQAYTTNFTAQQMALKALPPAGGKQPHNNLMAYLTLNFCIALKGIFPPRG